MSSTPTPEVAPTNDRLASLDQFRGYTVAGMFLVNFVGAFAAIAAFIPALKHWNNHCSYADTIMPQFLFAVGFGFRMSYVKGRERLGGSVDYWRIVRRILGLLLVAFFVHRLDGNYATWQELRELGIGGFFRESFQRSYFQTLAHIGVTSLWVVPVVGANALVRLAHMILSGVLFIYLSNQWYYNWEVTTPGIDGGPLGFLTWTSPLILGTLAHDIWQGGFRFPVLTTFLMGCVAMIVAYALACVSMFTFPNQLPADATLKDRLAECPFVRPLTPAGLQAQANTSIGWWSRLTLSGPDIPSPPESIEHWVAARKAAQKRLIAANELPADSSLDDVPVDSWRKPDARYLNQWTISQRAGSLSYTLFGGGFAMALLAVFMIVCDRWGFQLGVFRTLGVNALIGYIVHDLVDLAIKPFVPKDSPLWWIFLGFVVFFGICYLVLRTAEKQKIFFRL